MVDDTWWCDFFCKGYSSWNGWSVHFHLVDWNMFCLSPEHSEMDSYKQPWPTNLPSLKWQSTMEQHLDMSGLKGWWLSSFRSLTDQAKPANEHTHTHIHLIPWDVFGILFGMEFDYMPFPSVSKSSKWTARCGLVAFGDRCTKLYDMNVHCCVVDQFCALHLCSHSILALRPHDVCQVGMEECDMTEITIIFMLWGLFPPHSLVKVNPLVKKRKWSQVCLFVSSFCFLRFDVFVQWRYHVR